MQHKIPDDGMKDCCGFLCFTVLYFTATLEHSLLFIKNRYTVKSVPHSAAASRISCWPRILVGCRKRLCQVAWFSKTVLCCSRDLKTTGGWLSQKTPPLSNNAWLYSDQTHCVFRQGFLCLRLTLSMLRWPILVWILLLNSILSS